MAFTPSSILIRVGGVDVTDKVVFRETSFTSQANPMQGSFSLVIRDPDQTFSATMGQTVTCHIDGVPLFGGYLMRLGRGNFFPAADTSAPASVKSRKWILQGPDYNMIFDKRIVYDPSNPVVSPEVPSGKRTITKAFKHLMNNFIDAPVGIDFTTHVDTIRDDDGSETEYGTEENGSLYVSTGKTWRDQMEDFADHSGIIYYIDADFAIHLHGYESALSPFTISDTKVPGLLQFREGEYSEDLTRIVTEAHVWGGSSIRRSDGGTGGDIVYAKYPDPPPGGDKEQRALDRLALYGLWQRGEERAGQSNYLSQKSVNKRAKIIITGPTGAVPTYGLEAGFSRPLTRFTCTWFAHDVPGQAHIRPGNIQDIILYTQNVVTRLPLRSMTISFPTLPTGNTGNQTFVQFQGEFGTAYSDRRYLWTWLRRSTRGFTGVAVMVVDGTGSAAPGSLASVAPAETPNGTLKVFTFPYVFYQGRFDLWLNGLFQRAGIDYTYDADTRQVTFVTAPGTGDQIYATGYVGG